MQIAPDSLEGGLTGGTSGAAFETSDTAASTLPTQRRTEGSPGGENEMPWRGGLWRVAHGALPAALATLGMTAVHV